MSTKPKTRNRQAAEPLPPSPCSVCGAIPTVHKITSSAWPLGGWEYRCQCPKAKWWCFMQYTRSQSVGLWNEKQRTDLAKGKAH